MQTLAYYFTSVILYFLFGYFFLPDEICGTGWYFLGAILFPIVLLVVINIAAHALGHLLNSDYSLPENEPPPKAPLPKVSSSPMDLVESVLFDIPSSVPKGIVLPANTPVKSVISDSQNSVPKESPPAEQPELSEPDVPHLPTIDEMLRSVDLMDGPAFERWCAELLRKDGFSDIQLTKASGDQGVDITAVRCDIRHAFQCKCYSSDLGNHPVQEVHAGKSLYSCHVGVVMTNRHFTPGAKELAKATGTLLWDRDKLKSIIQAFYGEEYVPPTVGPSLFENDPSSYWD